MLNGMALFDANGQRSTKGVLVDQYGNELRPDESSADLALPYHATFGSIIQGASRSFIALGFDEAMKHSRENALAMRRDCRVLGWLAERKESVVSLKYHLEVPDETDSVQKAVKDGMTQIFRSIPRFKRMLRNLLESLWYGRYGVELAWQWDFLDLPAVPDQSLFPLGNDREAMLKKHLNQGGATTEDGDGKPTPSKKTERRKVLIPFKHRPINGDKINFGWDGTPMIGIYAAAQIPGAVTTWDNQKPVLVLTKEWRERFLIHQYDPDDADYFEAEKAGGVHGVGIRSRIYWLNWIRQDYAAWIQDYFDRVGLGFICVKYDLSNPKGKEEAENICKKWNRRSTLAVPTSPDQMNGDVIQVVDVPSAGALVVQELIKYADQHLERFILRQSMSSGESGREGMGGTAGPAKMAENTENQRIRADAEDLEETLTGSDDEPGLCSVIQRWTYPGTYPNRKNGEGGPPTFRVRFRFNVDDTNPKEKLEALKLAADLGCEFPESDVTALVGMRKAEPGEKTVGGKPPAPTLPGMPGKPGEPKPGVDGNPHPLQLPGQPFGGAVGGGGNGNGKAPKAAE